MAKPYEIIEVDKRRVVVRFASGDVTANRTREHLDELLSLVDTYDRVAVDFSRSPLVPSDWLRAIERLRIRAGAAGKDVIIVGAAETIKKTADALKLRDALRWCNSVEEAWTL